MPKVGTGNKILKQKPRVLRKDSINITPGGPLHSDQILESERSLGPRILQKQKSQKKDSLNIPANVKNINFAHENFNLVFNIMLGIKKSIEATFEVDMLNISDKEYKIKCKYEIAPFRTE